MSKDKQTEYTANVAMGYAPAKVAKIGRNFAKPIPRLVKQEQKTFLQKLIAMGKKS